MGKKKKNKGAAASSTDVIDRNLRRDLEQFVKEIHKDTVQCTEISSSTLSSGDGITSQRGVKVATKSTELTEKSLNTIKKGQKRKFNEPINPAQNNYQVVNKKQKHRKGELPLADVGGQGLNLAKSIDKHKTAGRVVEQEDMTTTKMTSDGDLDHKKKERKKKRKDEKEEKSQDENVQSALDREKKLSSTKKIFGDNGDLLKCVNLNFLENINAYPRCIVKIKPEEKWFNILHSAELNKDGKNTEREISGTQLDNHMLAKIEEYTKKLYAGEMENFTKLNSNSKNLSSEKAWIRMVLKSGTLPDKMSAFSVLLQEDPVHNLSSLETLVNMVSLKSRRPCMLALEALRDLFCNHLLADDRRLKTFPGGQRIALTQLLTISGSDKEELDRQLILMCFENKVKSIFARFLEALDDVSKDTLDQTKLKAMAAIYDLLVANPEQEAGNLARLVNNLGDPTRGIAAKAGYQLNKLLEVHPVMKNVVLGEVERLLYRPNVAKRAQYYGICCLSQMMLDGYEDESAEMAKKLIGIYFSFFKLFAVKKGDLDSKLISALLTGVNRAYPYLSKVGASETDKSSPTSLASHVETMYRVVHMTSNYGTALQALTLLFQLAGGGRTAAVGDQSQQIFGAITSAERFYTTLYKKLLDVHGVSNSSSKQALFLNLVYKAMKADTEISRSLVFVRRLLQSCTYLPSHLVCSILYLLSELFRNRSDIKQAFTTILSKPATPGNLFSEKCTYNAGTKAAKDNAEESSSDEEFYKDVDNEDNKDTKITPSESSSWVFKNLQATPRNAKLGKDGSVERKSYDPEVRNPLYAIRDEAAKRIPMYHDSATCAWELSELSGQFHPSVQLFVSQLLEDNGPKPIVYSGDPLSDFTLIRFLDRFVFRNPKKDPGKGKPNSVFGKRNVYKPMGVKRLAVDSKEYFGISDISRIPSDERFIHAYFRRYSLSRTNRVDDHPEDEDDDAASVNSDDFDEAIRTSSSKVDLDFASALDADENGTDDEEDDIEDVDYSDGVIEGDSVDNEDYESDFEEVEDFDNLSDDMNSNEEDDEFQETKAPQKGKKARTIVNASKNSKSGKKSYNLESLMASAEDYEQLIEEDNANDMDGMAGSIDDVFNKDKSGAKQLKWEAKRRNMQGNKINKVSSSKFKQRKKGGYKQKFGKKQ